MYWSNRIGHLTLTLSNTMLLLKLALNEWRDNNIYVAYIQISILNINLLLLVVSVGTNLSRMVPFLTLFHLPQCIPLEKLHKCLLIKANIQENLKKTWMIHWYWCSFAWIYLSVKISNVNSFFRSAKIHKRVKGYIFVHLYDSPYIFIH